MTQCELLGNKTHARISMQPSGLPTTVIVADIENRVTRNAPQPNTQCAIVDFANTVIGFAPDGPKGVCTSSGYCGRCARFYSAHAEQTTEQG